MLLLWPIGCVELLQNVMQQQNRRLPCKRLIQLLNMKAGHEYLFGFNWMQQCRRYHFWYLIGTTKLVLPI